jgi:hypothetical protein
LTCLFLFFHIINIHGIEIDKKSGNIKEYKKLFWFRIGKWEKIKNYTTLCLTKGKLSIPTSFYSDHKSDTYFYFFVKLVNETSKKELILFSHQNYLKTKEFIDQISTIIGLEIKINIHSLKKL